MLHNIHLLCSVLLQLFIISHVPEFVIEPDLHSLHPLFEHSLHSPYVEHVEHLLCSL